MRATSIGHAGIFIETRQGSILCDPWFNPAYFGSWFVFPRNDQLNAELAQAIRQPDYLYISHLHGDHLDEQWLVDNISPQTPVLLPDYPTQELERRLRHLGFTHFITTSDGIACDLGDDLSIAIHVETSITDGPAGDSALVVSDGVHRIVNQNDCRTSDLSALLAHGPIDLHFLQYSGAIWYPMVYDEPTQRMRELVDLKVESQFARAMRYVEALNARAIVPSAGPPCFLDPELFAFNDIAKDSFSIFPDQTKFLSQLNAVQRHGIINIPGTCITLGDNIEVLHPIAEADVQAIFSDKESYLRNYQSDYLVWLEEMKTTWSQENPDLLTTLKLWWEPLLAMAPALRRGVGAACLLRAGDLEILIDFPNGEVRLFNNEAYGFRFEIDRRLVETVVSQNAADWSDKLFLSLRFKAWRSGSYNEFIYNFFKSLSVERMQRTEAEALKKFMRPEPSEEITIGDYIVERFCPHRQADLGVFGEQDGTTLTCTLHGWKFDLESGECLTADDRKLRVRRASEPI